MKKYQWNDVKLRKKSQLYTWLMLAFGLILVSLFFANAPAMLLLLPGVGVFTTFVLGWQTQSQDIKLKTNNKPK